MNARRRVLVQLVVPFEDLLAPGEAPPPVALQDHYATARAPARLHQTCAELLERLATRCDAGDTSGRVGPAAPPRSMAR